MRSAGKAVTVFAVDKLSLGHTTVVKYHIRLQDETPFKERPRLIQPSDREVVKQHHRELLDAGKIRDFESPFASPVVLVRKRTSRRQRLRVPWASTNLTICHKV